MDPSIYEQVLLIITILQQASGWPNIIAIHAWQNKHYTVETRIKEPVSIGTLRLKCHLFSPLNKNTMEAKTGNGSYIIGFMLFELKTQE